jgi:hypothetical protein
MDDQRKIVWLASYPKSGNTWLRGFITALLHPGNAGIDINNLYTTTIASSRQLFDELTGVSSADLAPEEIEKLRPMVSGNMRESEEIFTRRCMMPDRHPPELLFPSTKRLSFISSVIPWMWRYLSPII